MDSDPIVDLSNFTLLNNIGEGHFAEVYRIQDNKTGKIYAAKLLYRRVSPNSEGEDLYLKRELNTMVKIKHPNIVQFIGFSPTNFHKENKPIIISELMTNGRLTDVINKEKNSQAPQGWNATKKLINMYGIAAAMAFLHSHGIIHRDLKPDNILMDELLNPKIADFGLVKLIGDSAQDSLSAQSTRGPKGSYTYMAPEVLNDYNFSNECDVYSYALICYEIVTNKFPYEELTVSQIISLIPTGLRPEIPESTEEAYKVFIESCWDNDPEERPTFEKILEVLKNFPGFITPEVNKKEFLDYVETIEKSQIIFDSARKIKLFEKKANTVNDHSDPISCKRRADNGDAISMYNYALMLYKGDGIPVNNTEAARYFKKAADKGESHSMYYYALMMRDGIGVSVNKKEAARYFKMAIEKSEDRIKFAIATANYKIEHILKIIYNFEK